MTLLHQFLRNEEGATAVEYGLIVAVLSMAIIAGFSNFSAQLQDMFGNRFVSALNTH